jgi:hypothetical protein
MSEEEAGGISRLEAHLGYWLRRVFRPRLPEIADRNEE